MNFVLIPGGWMGSWAWEAVAQHLRDYGHGVYAVTLSGLEDGERDVSGIGPGTHVEDVLGVLERNHLRDVIVVGHLYSGVVAGQVADRARDRVVHTVFVESFLPHDGHAMLDAYDDEQSRQAELDEIAENNGRWLPPTPANLSHERDLTDEQRRWMAGKFVGHPGRTVSEPVSMTRPLAEQRATYVACSNAGHWASEDVQSMRSEPNWTFRNLESGHWPMISVPDRLAEILDDVATLARSEAARR